MSVTDQAFVTLGTNDIYCQGALVLGQSLRNHKTSRKLAILISPEVTKRMKMVLSSVFDEIIEVNILDSADSVNLALMKRPELGITFTKLHCWTLTQYSKCVFMDADTLVLCNVDELFDRDELSAAPDSGWPDCFNSGVFVFRPSLETYHRLLQFAAEHGSFDGGDQGLLNSFFSNWATRDISKHLPFIYNLSSSSVYTYIPAFRQFGSDAKVIHFLGPSKPWTCTYNPQNRSVTEEGTPLGHQQLAFIVLWWETFISCVLPLLAAQEEAVDEDNQQQKGIKRSLSCNPIHPVRIWHHYGGIEVTMKREDSFPSPPTVASPEASPYSTPPGSPERTVELAHSVSELSIQIKEEEPKTEDQRQKWEAGQMDYMGKDSFENIKKRLDKFL